MSIIRTHSLPFTKASCRQSEIPWLRRTALITLTMVSPAAHADVGVPMIAVFLPPMWLAFIPIVLVEALVLARLLKISFGRAVAPAFLSNLVSTLIGVPLMWLVLAVLELICCGEARGLTAFSAKLYAVTVQAPWLIPYEQDLRWMIPCALAVLAIPCFAASVMVEAPVNRYLLRYADGRSLWKATATANACSYVLLALLIWPAWKLADHMPGLFGPVGEWFVKTTYKVVGALTGTH